MKTLKIAATVAALIAGPAAMAQIVTPSNGPSDMFGIVFNSSTGAEVTIDLGASVNTFNFGTTQTFNLDTSLAQLEADLGTSTPGALSFTVVAADNFNTGGAVGTPNGIAADFISSSVPSGVVAGTVVNMAGGLNSYLIGASSSFNSASPPPPTFRLVANGSTNTSLEWTGAGNPGASATTWQPFAATVGSSVQLYSEQNLNFSGKSAPPPTQTALGGGLWSIDFSNDQLDYTVGGPPVPVPPALWLLLSGLVGVAAIGRRRSGLVGGMTA